MNPRFEAIVEGIGIPKSLRWRNGSLYYSDIAKGTVVRWSSGGASEVIATVPGAAGIGWLPNGDMLIASSTTGRVHRLATDGTMLVHADLRGRVRGALNDLIVDPLGRAYIGDYGFNYEERIARRSHAFLYEPPGIPRVPLLRIEPDGGVKVASSPLVFPNGCALIDGGRTLVVAETLAFRLAAFDVDERGILSRHRVWASFIGSTLWRAVNAKGAIGAVTRRASSMLEHPLIARRSRSPVAPDAISEAGDGSLWVANSLRGECVRVAEGGRVLERRAVSNHALGCVVGDGALYVATVPTLDPTRSADDPRGRIERLELTKPVHAPTTTVEPTPDLEARRVKHH